jgi:hypothetical protein
MSALTCTDMAELVDELALDVLPGDQRAEALDHLDGCPACRARLEALSEPADQLLLACRSVEPPPGFEDRVLARLATGRTRPRRRGRLAALVAAGAAAGALIGLGGVSLGRQGPHPAAAGAYGPQLRTVALLSGNGRRIGDVSAYAGPPTWIFLRVDGGTGSGIYSCVLDVEGGRTIDLGTMSVSDGEGGWGQRVSIDPRLVESARLVGPTGATVATAIFH